MGDLLLEGMLHTQGSLRLEATGGKVKASSLDVLVVGATGDASAPVLLPTPASPIDSTLRVRVVASFNQTVTASGKAIVAQGMCVEGALGLWPGIVHASFGNLGVTANATPMNVKGDLATILPTGAPATLGGDSGQ